MGIVRIVIKRKKENVLETEKVLICIPLMGSKRPGTTHWVADNVFYGLS
jgi:hypothetical protein